MRRGLRAVALYSVIFSAAAIVSGLPSIGGAAAGDSTVDLPLLRRWSGDYPVARLSLLPERQRRTRAGYLGDGETFARVWNAFRPGEDVPDVDFDRNLVLFSRNVEFYNRTAIAKVQVKDGVAEILAIETLSAIPIGDKVAVALAEVPRSGIRYIASGSERIAVSDAGSAATPLDAAYTIDGRRIVLRNGRHEEEAGPGSAAMAVVRVFGRPAYGDLDGDGREDAALFLLYAPGGSGTFLYVAAAVRGDSGYRGTNAVLLGDRISPGTIEIRNGLVFVDYVDRRPGEPMASLPSVTRTKTLALRDGSLAAVGPPAGPERPQAPAVP